MSDNQVTGRIAKLDRLNNSTNGNPTWRITLDGGEVLRTQSDAAVSYGLSNPEYRDALVRFDLTKAGRVYGATVLEGEHEGYQG